MYERINNQGDNAVETACPDCGQRFDVSVYNGAVVDAEGGPEAAGAEMETPGAPGGEGDSGN